MGANGSQVRQKTRAEAEHQPHAANAAQQAVTELLSAFFMFTVHGARVHVLGCADRESLCHVQNDVVLYV